jgi:hypothetical protein
MKNLKLFLAGMLLSVCLMTNATPAKATCYIYSAIPIRVTMYPSGTAYVYFHPQIWYDNYSSTASTKYSTAPAVSSSYGYARIDASTAGGAALAIAAQDAVKSQTRILIYGDAAKCPNAYGTSYIGKTTVMVVNP